MFTIFYLNLFVKTILKCWRILCWLRASAGVDGLFKRWCEVEDLGQWTIMCSILCIVLHRSHKGLVPWWSDKNEWDGNGLFWLFITICSRLHELFRYVYLNVVFLTFFSLLFSRIEFQRSCHVFTIKFVLFCPLVKICIYSFQFITVM